MKSPLVLFLSFALVIQVQGQTKTLAERLGYPADTKLLIIHADDVGVSHSENMATIQVMEKGYVNSASIMVPCPWFPEIAAYAKAHPTADFGLHLTLTSEWNVYKWGPVTSHHEVPSLLDTSGYLNATTLAFRENAKLMDVERELRNQIERAKKFGIDPTHLDAHMFAVESTPELVQIYLKLGREYKVPVHVAKELVAAFFSYDPAKFMVPGDIVVDKTIILTSPEYPKGTEQFYVAQMRSLVKGGLNVILLHAAYNNDEMEAVTAGFKDNFDAGWRQKDVNFFTSDTCKKIIAEEKIRLITWREIRDKLFR